MRLTYILLTISIFLALPAAFAQYPGSYSQETSASQSYSSDNSVVEYSQYYSFSSTVEGGRVSSAEKYVTASGPSYIYMGSDRKKIPYSNFQYSNYYGQGNFLWIEGDDSWTDYAKVPKDSYLDLIAIAPYGGNAYLYEEYPNGQTKVSTITIFPNSRISFYADTPGKHTLYFVMNNVPSNVVVIDVQTTSPFGGFGSDWATVNLVSDWKGYSILIDDVFALTEGTGGVPDGIANFPVRGNEVHKITISQGGQTRSTEQYFETGQRYNISL
jgi:hypothetical protein